jgi:hypothetical protein
MHNIPLVAVVAKPLHQLKAPQNFAIVYAKKELTLGYLLANLVHQEQKLKLY